MLVHTCPWLMPDCPPLPFPFLVPTVYITTFKDDITNQVHSLIQAYPFSPPPSAAVAGPSTQSLLKQWVSIFFMLPAKLAISYRNKFPFFDKWKETFRFWASGCHVKGPLPPPPLHTRYSYEEMHAPGQNWGVVTWQVLFFLPRVAGFPRPRSHMTWIFRFLVLFAK
jgi:hypothetical protein